MHNRRIVHRQHTLPTEFIDSSANLALWQGIYPQMWSLLSTQDVWRGLRRTLAGAAAAAAPGPFTARCCSASTHWMSVTVTEGTGPNQVTPAFQGARGVQGVRRAPRATVRLVARSDLFGSRPVARTVASDSDRAYVILCREAATDASGATRICDGVLEGKQTRAEADEG